MNIRIYNLSGTNEMALAFRHNDRCHPTCHDCGVKNGEYHKNGCDWETCPFCFQQLISCECDINLYSNMNIDFFTWL